MVRAFVALELSEEIRRGLAGAEEILSACTARLTFVEPALIHITAKFLGEIDEKTIPRIAGALAGIPFAPFPVTAGAVTVNNPNRPHTVWSAVEDGGRGRTLVAAIDAALAPLGIPPEIRRFTPHATIARVRSMDPSLFAVLRKLDAESYGSCTIGGMKLKKSTLTPRGPVYEDLFEVKW
jgi:2'-5' RNA ligase